MSFLEEGETSQRSREERCQDGDKEDDHQRIWSLIQKRSMEETANAPPGELFPILCHRVDLGMWLSSVKYYSLAPPG